MIPPTREREFKEAKRDLGLLPNAIEPYCSGKVLSTQRTTRLSSSKMQANGIPEPSIRRLEYTMYRVHTKLQVSMASRAGLPASLLQPDGTVCFVSRPFRDQMEAEKHAVDQQIQESDHDVDGNIVLFPGATFVPECDDQYPTLDQMTVVKGWSANSGRLMHVAKGNRKGQVIMPVAKVKRYVVKGEGYSIGQNVHPTGWTMMMARGASDHSDVLVKPDLQRKRRDRDDDEGGAQTFVVVTDRARNEDRGRVLMDDLIAYLNGMRDAEFHEFTEYLRTHHGLARLPSPNDVPSSLDAPALSDDNARPQLVQYTDHELLQLVKEVQQDRAAWSTSPTPWDHPTTISPTATLAQWGTANDARHDSDNESMPSLQTISSSSSESSGSDNEHDEQLAYRTVTRIPIVHTETAHDVSGRIYNGEDKHMPTLARGRSISPRPLSSTSTSPRNVSAPPALPSPRQFVPDAPASSPEVSTPDMWEVLNDAAAALGATFPPQQLTDAIDNLANLCGLSAPPPVAPVKNELIDEHMPADASSPVCTHELPYRQLDAPPTECPSMRIMREGPRLFSQEGDWINGIRVEDLHAPLALDKKPSDNANDDLDGQGIRVTAIEPPASLSPFSSDDSDFSDLTGLYDPLRVDTTFVEPVTNDVPMEDSDISVEQPIPPPMQADYSFTPSLSTISAVEGILVNMKGMAGFANNTAASRAPMGTHRLVFPTPDAVMEAYVTGGPAPPRHYAAAWMTRRIIVRILKPLVDRAHQQGLLEFLDKFNTTVAPDAYGEMALATLFFPKGCYDGCPYLDPTEELEVLQARLFFGVTNPFLEQHSIVAMERALAHRTPWAETQYLVYLRINGWLGRDWTIPAHGFQPTVTRYNELGC
ncbi:hypothetical protein BDY19DRAFT_998112 [Irpex rosettiformis]|uniref:Uncharacterized protein n=1 Tax=Irpex rosettiformis TaxID=378272 RepID=A0ACB8TPZ8_9APHY|nr:hypothetical protein BDY19DRAFT_998112 [Irpex rosettiformis]